MPEKASITLPYNYTPRLYQQRLYNCIADGYKRAVAVWHRRSGKDKTLINLLVKEAFKRVGIYYYLFPTYQQGRKVLWDGIDRNGFKYLKHIPDDLIDGKPNQAEMKIKLVNGSIIQIVGTDNIDSIMGTNPVGCVFSEYSLQNPEAWDLIRPILAENGGWAVFNYTPRGRNHGFKLYEMAQHNPEWFCELLTIEDTGAVGKDMVQAEREAGMSEEMVQQEFYCSFEASLASCFFAGAMEGHKEAKRGVLGLLRKDQAKQEIEFNDYDRGYLEIWRFPYFVLEDWDTYQWTYRYCIGSDIAEGLGGKRDYSVAYVYDRRLKEIVARMRTNEIDSYKWGDKLHQLSLYYENALIVPERNGAGITTIQRLQALKANIYTKEQVAVVGGTVTSVYGWLETREAKQQICGGLKAYLGEKYPIYDRLLLSECATFIKDEEKERLGADDGFHDDCVIAAALAIQGDKYLPKCERIEKPLTGWRKREYDRKENNAIWAA